MWLIWITKFQSTLDVQFVIWFCMNPMSAANASNLTVRSALKAGWSGTIHAQLVVRNTWSQARYILHWKVSLKIWSLNVIIARRIIRIRIPRYLMSMQLIVFKNQFCFVPMDVTLYWSTKKIVSLTIKNANTQLHTAPNAHICSNNVIKKLTNKFVHKK